MKERKSALVFNAINYTFFAILSVICIYPIWYCIAGSFMSQGEYLSSTILLWPKTWTLGSYRYIFDQGQIMAPMFNSILITIVGTPLNLLVTSMMAYGMSKQYPFSKLVSTLVLISMIVSAGLIPNYILYRYLKILNTYWVYILPSMVNTFYLIILRTNFNSFPRELEEAAIIDGCGPFRIFFQIVLPLSKAILATVLLFVAVDFWNTYSTSMYYVMDVNKKTLQEYLYRIIGDTNNNGATSIADVSAGADGVFSANIKLANTVIAIVPILIVYPFLQRYFTQGVMIGALKG